MRLHLKEYPRPTDNLLNIMSDAKKGKYSQKEAFKILVSTPELLDPVSFLLFSHDTDLQDAVPYKEYVMLMKQRAIKSKNQGLLNMVNELDGEIFD